ncbi:CNNM domain-containing protein [Stratiformator vulcanicus]|uniref:CNNM transmembrane domain-containing protein n=1 Tax=Stratiformator vulcanicus TaxID=2527980 RepID=A0A517R6U6_9PLAN|nr:CNNM domain-containing protein [Stratiformator vulcanicus]QDT39599.1 hypothetical protein Pan189_40080 [Stratiformator vulcanicus]
MLDWMLISSIALFLLGLSLSAFFSGSETGFYRLSPLRVAVEAGSGDRTGRRLLWLTRHPDRFVATTLVGNNVANYLTTMAIGLFSASIFVSTSGLVEVAATWLTSPLIFVLGELLPKTLYFRAPMHFLRPGTPLFVMFYWLFLPISLPLTSVSRLCERMARSPARQTEFVLARSRFGQYLTTGHREGLLGELQSRLLQNLVASSTQRVSSSVTPRERMYEISVETPPAEALQHAVRFALTEIPVRTPGSLTDPNTLQYVRVAEIAATEADSLKPLLRPLPRVDVSQTKLLALMTLRKAEQSLGAVYEGDQFVGIVKERGLIGQFLRSSQSIGEALPTS